MSVSSRVVNDYYCDITGKRLGRDDERWWVCETAWDGVMGEYYTPFDLCEDMRKKLNSLFSNHRELCLKKGYVYERYERSKKREVTKEFIDEFKKDVEDLCP